MGTIGLSFGSPTSGTGFDVSATVTKIVENLRKVETPWTTQLTSLQSQDTALSGIGTLLSALSTDVSKLTDFTGVMAQKTGSSSDNNVVQLRAATSSATAGTHTVTVSSLAKTASGHITAVTNSSDKLSGSLSIQIGAGKTHTVNLTSTNNTLAGLAASINAAGIGVTASVLTDASGSRLSLVSGTSGANGNLTVIPSITDTTDSNASLAYRPTISGTDAQLNVDGVDLKSSSNTVSNLIPGLTFQLLAPSAALADNSLVPVQVVIGNDNTGVETAINQMVMDYNALVTAINTQNGNDSSGKPEPLFGSPTISLLQQQIMSSLNAQNPNGYLDSIASGSETTLAGSLTIQVGTGTGRQIDVPASDASLSGLADAINNAKIGVIAAVVTKNGESSLTLQSQTTGAAGTLDVTSNLTATTGSESTALNYTNSSNLTSLNGLGITVSPKSDGTVTFDASVLDEDLNSNFSGVLGFFQAANSWGQAFASMLSGAGTNSSTGILSMAKKANGNIESSMNDNISKQEARIAIQQKNLTAQLNLANQILQQLPSQLSGMEMLYSAVTGYNQKNG